MTRRWLRAGAGGASLVLFLWLVVAGCAHEDAPSRTLEVAAGRIEGVVATGGAQLPMVVRATRIPDAGQSLAIVQVKPDASGRYTMDVPAGRYVVSLYIGTSRAEYDYSAAGLRFGDAPGDTLRVDESTSPLSVNFDLATVVVRMELPGVADGMGFDVSLERQGLSVSRPTCLRSGTTEVRGGSAEITLAGVLPGAYRVVTIVGRRYYMCDCAWDGEYIWMPGTRRPADSPWTAVEPGQVVRVSGRVETAPARIEGQIGGAWLEMGLGPPDLALFDVDSTMVRGFRQVDSDGKFVVGLLLPGAVKVCVRHDGADRWIGGDSFREARVFQLETGQTISGADLQECVLRLDFTASGMNLGQPAVEVFDQATMARVVHLSYTDPRGGIVTVPNLKPGSYLLYVEPGLRGDSEWLPQWYDRAARVEDGLAIRITTEGSTVLVPVTLEKGGRIQGGAVGAGEREFLFYLTAAGDRTRWALGYGQSSGRGFDFRGVPDGDWKIGAWHRVPGSYPQEAPEGTTWYPGTADWNAAGVISIRDAGEVTGLQVAIPEGR